MRYTENDEIELGLTNFGTKFFHLIWRYKKCRKFLFLKIRNRWHTVKKYYPSLYKETTNPDNSLYWGLVSFDLTSQEDIAQYNSLKDKIVTKKDLWDYIEVVERNRQYEKDKEKYLSYKHFLKENVKKLVFK